MARDDRRRGGRRDGRRDRQKDDGDSDLFDKLVSINRVAKVVKGGRRFGFAALVVVGDRRGRVGFGAGKAREVPEAIRKATEQAKRRLIRVPLRDGRTLHHDVTGRYGAGRVLLRAAPAGTGVIAGGPMRAVFETLGVHDVVTKSLGTSNPHNMVRATFAALSGIQAPRAVAAKRGKKVAELMGRRPAAASNASAAPARAESEQAAQDTAETERPAPAPAETGQAAPAPAEIESPPPPPDAATEQAAQAPAEAGQTAPAPDAATEQAEPVVAEAEQAAPAPAEIESPAPAPAEAEQAAPAPAETESPASPPDAGPERAAP